MSVLLLTRSDVAALLNLEQCIPAVEEAFRLLGEGKARPPGVLGVACGEGGFHIKAGVLATDGHYFAAKVNANFPRNPQRNRLPTIQGVIVLSDADTGCPLAVMDSMEITTLRTGAATAVAASRLARPDASTATICGCGNQGRIQLQAIAHVRSLRRVFAFDQEPRRARAFADEMAQPLKLSIEPCDDLSSALRQSDICVTCTPARQFFVRKQNIRPGTFIAAVGSDNHDKQEL